MIMALKIFVIGWAILLAAIILNYIAMRLNLKTWYSFTNDPRGTDIVSYVWLFVVYPISLGLAGYLATKFLL